MNLTTTEIEKLEATKSAIEWNAVCDGIKRARGGQYPLDWFQKVTLTGLLDEIQESWGNSTH